MKKTTKRILIPLIIVVALGVAYFLLPKYAQTALIYQKVGINDYPIFSNRTVSVDQPQPWKVDALFSEMKLKPETLNKMEELEPIAFLVIKDNSIIFEKYWDNYGPESLTNSFSMAKSIIGLLIGAAIDDGYIKSVKQPVSDFVPAFKTSESKQLTIADVLTMSSGLNWDESYGSLFNTTTEAYYGKDIKKLITSLKVIEPPGQEFKYLSGNTQLLALVVENATGKKVANYAAEKFWMPMGAENDALWCLDDEDGTEKAYCCFNSNARDFARWGQLILNYGTWNGDTLIAPSYVEALVTPASHLVNDNNQPVNFYGYQWWIHHYNNWEVPYMRGILGQYVFVIPDENAVVVRLGHKRSSTYTDYHPNDTYLYLKAAKQVIDDYKQNRER